MNNTITTEIIFKSVFECVILTIIALFSSLLLVIIFQDRNVGDWLGLATLMYLCPDYWVAIFFVSALFEMN